MDGFFVGKPDACGFETAKSLLLRAGALERFRPGDLNGRQLRPGARGARCQID